jgi:hypothetical protein
MNGRFLFRKRKRKWGFNSVRHSGTFPHQSGAVVTIQKDRYRLSKKNRIRLDFEK